MNENETTNKTFEIKDGKYIYKITDLEFNPEKERLYGKIKLKGEKNKSNFYIDFENENVEADDYKEKFHDSIYKVIEKFYSDYIEEEINCNNENGNFILTKRIIFK